MFQRDCLIKYLHIKMTVWRGEVGMGFRAITPTHHRTITASQPHTYIATPRHYRFRGGAGEVRGGGWE